jgi:hypothetical protein
MSLPACPRLAWKTLGAIGALLAALHAHAAPPAPESAQADAIGATPMADACPALDRADLAESLNAAWDDADKPSAVAVTFKVQGRHVYGVTPATASARTRHQIRRALGGLRCEAGDDVARAVRLIVRFEDGRGGSRLAAIDAAPDR